MWKSIIYKEWLKIRWFAILYAALGVLVVGNIFLKVQHDFEFGQAENYWYSILFQGNRFFEYSLFKFVPFVGALVLAIAQYFPETVNKRIKLTFHLPVNENKALLVMMLFGAFLLFRNNCYSHFAFYRIKSGLFSSRDYSISVSFSSSMVFMRICSLFYNRVNCIGTGMEISLFISYGSSHFCAHLPSNGCSQSVLSYPSTVNCAYNSFISCIVVFRLSV